MAVRALTGRESCDGGARRLSMTLVPEARRLAWVHPSPDLGSGATVRREFAAVRAPHAR
jgi:hypothetical protein